MPYSLRPVWKLILISRFPHTFDRLLVWPLRSAAGAVLSWFRLGAPSADCRQAENLFRQDVSIFKERFKCGQLTVGFSFGRVVFFDNGQKGLIELSS